MLIAIGKIAIYIMTTKLNCTAGLTSAKLKVDVPVWRADAAWKIAARTRGPGARLFTAGLFKSSTMMRRTSTEFIMNRIPKSIHVGLLGNSRV